MSGRAVLCLLVVTQLQPLLAVSLGRQPAGFSGIIGASGYGGANLPEGLSQSGKLRAFLVCRKECIAKCDRLVYVYSEKKEFCHECLKQCISAVVQQARSLGVDLNAVDESPSIEQRPQMLSDSAAASAVGDGQRGGRRERQAKDKEERRRRRRRQRQRERERNRKRRRGADRTAGGGGGGDGAGGGGQQGLLKNCIVH